MFNNSGYSLADIAAATGNNGSNNGFGDGNGWWIILLFLMFGIGGRGWGYGVGGSGGAGGSTVREEIAYGFDMNGLSNSVRGVQQGLCDGFYALNNSVRDVQASLCQGFNGINTSILTSGYQTLDAIHADTIANMQNTNAINASLTGLGTQLASCCCDIRSDISRGLSDLGYALATQESATRQAIADTTRDIIDTQNASTRAILDFLTQDKIAALTAENQSLKFAASQQAQNAYLVGALKDPCPVPAYVVPNPNCCYPNIAFAGFNSCNACNNFGYAY